MSVNALTGSGKAHGQMDERQQAGMDSQRCAAVIVKAIARGKREIVVGASGGAMLGVILSRFAPSILARLLRKAKVT